jgi:ABC-type uncharacterized transport system substrate-binding protein
MDGGLASYGVDVPDMFRARETAGNYFDRALKGVSPADLPVQAPTKFKPVINVRAAKALGLTVPPSLRHCRRVMLFAAVSRLLALHVNSYSCLEWSPFEA